MEFREFHKIPRFSREIIVTEKIDGTNGVIGIEAEAEHVWTPGEVPPVATVDGFSIYAGSKSRWLDVWSKGDNFGFAKWVYAHAEELLALGPGMHYGEWWGYGIQRGYDLPKGERRFSLFNVSRWADTAGAVPTVRPACCHVVPVVWRGRFDTEMVDIALQALAISGSLASPGFMNPEGIIVFHTAGNLTFKKTLGDDGAKGGTQPQPQERTTQ